VTATAPDPLALDEALLVCLALGSRRHWSEPAGALGLSPTIRIAKERLDDRPAAATSLSDLAVLAGTSRFQLLRGFVRELGATPHAYLVQQRFDLRGASSRAGCPRPRRRSNAVSRTRAT
jgi:hypothetical protein